MELTDNRWQQLKANYTNGARVAELLRLVRDGAPADSWYDELFQESCHQYMVSEAAFAALPHLVVLASERPVIRMELLVLAASCVTYAAGSQLPPEEFTIEWYTAARDAIPLTAGLLGEEIESDNNLRYLVFALASFHGEHALAEAIEALDTMVECPNCGHWINRMRPGPCPGYSS